MGQFSWKYSDTNKQMINGATHNSYLLVPKPYQNIYGKYIKETCYYGYGEMGEYDVYDLVARWNKDFIPTVINYVNSGKWHASIDNEDLQNLENYYYGKDIDCEERIIGILLACYDEDNERLPYPIKIVEDRNLEYDEVVPSKCDENQGWLYEEEEYEMLTEEEMNLVVNIFNYVLDNNLINDSSYTVSRIKEFLDNHEE